MSYLIDTNVISELRKGERADQNVVRWYATVLDDEIYLSVMVLGELRRGIESIRRRDPRTAVVLDNWLNLISTQYESRILHITPSVVDVWGQLNVPDRLPVIDGLIAATAHTHHLIVVTRNTKDIARAGVRVLNPFVMT
ncbi:MAG: type II toxin-antitoxin system VapC family toxin [Bradymonadia bacterium]